MKLNVTALFLILLSPSFLLVQAQEKEGVQPSESEVKVVKTDDLSGKATQSRISTLSKSTKDVKIIQAYLLKQGYKPLTSDKDFYGQEMTREAVKDKQQLMSHLYIQNYSKNKSSTDFGAIGITGCDAKGSKPYVFALFIPNGVFDQAEEYYVDNGKVVKANSWKSCIRNNMAGCAGTCVAAAVTCSGTAVAYLGCLGVACGSCLAWETACCSCDCGRFCKLVVGCCRR